MKQSQVKSCKRIEQIKERLAKATPGPWLVSNSVNAGWVGGVVCEPWHEIVSGRFPGEQSFTNTVAVPALNHNCEIESDAGHNMTLIANAPADIQYLIDEVEGLCKLNDEIRAEWNDCMDQAREQGRQESRENLGSKGES